MTELTAHGIPGNRRPTSLKQINLANNGLTGAIPRQLAGITSLQGLWLGGNRLTGPIPDELGDLPELRSLHLSDNEPARPWPETIANPRTGLTVHLPDSAGPDIGLSGPTYAGYGSHTAFPLGRHPPFTVSWEISQSGVAYSSGTSSWLGTYVRSGASDLSVTAPTRKALWSRP